LNIDWQVENPILSEKSKNSASFFRHFDRPFLKSADETKIIIMNRNVSYFLRFIAGGCLASWQRGISATNKRCELPGYKQAVL